MPLKYDLNQYSEFLVAHQKLVDRPLIPATTVVIMRDKEADGIEVLMVLRNPDLKFMGGSWVFPGGRIEDSDYGDNQNMTDAIFNSAIRETKEETSIELVPNNLVPHSHWVPPPVLPKLFATWFLLTHSNPKEITVDGSEIIDHQWIAPEAALKKRDDGEFEFAPPTFVTLSMLAKFNSAVDALEDAKNSTPSFFETKIVNHNGDTVALWAGDAGYEQGDPSIAGARFRLNMSANKWELETGTGY